MSARLSRTALFLLVVGLLVSLVQPLLPRDGVSDPAVFVAAARARASELEPGDVVLIHPPWREDAVVALEEARLLPRGASATVALAPPHGQAPGRVLILVDEGAPPLPRSLRGRLSGRQRGGGITSGWLRARDDEGGLDLGARIALAQVHVERPDGTVVSCRFDGAKDRHLCPGLPDWMWVGPDSLLVSGSPTRCVWSHPLSGGKVVVRFDDVTLKDEVRFAHALSDTAAAVSKGAPVTAALRLDDEPLGRAVRDNAPGMKEEVWRVPSPGRSTSLTLELTTPSDGARHYCWTLRSPAARSDP
jgi:hypothetical protein